MLTSGLGPSRGRFRTVRRDRIDLIVREGRGRLGGTMFLDLLIQRARANGRRVKPMDGDLKSRTLSTLYPSKDPRGRAIEDGASSPVSDDIAHQKDWIQEQLNQMTEDRVSRILDLSGGDRVMQELVLDLMLKDFCGDFGIGLTNIVMLGPDVEDFNHAMERFKAEDSRGDRVIFVLNEGVIRQGQTTEGAFDHHHQTSRLCRCAEGGRSVYPASPIELHACPARARYRLLRCGGWAAGSEWAKVPPTVQHMTKVWLGAFERSSEDIAEWLP